MISAKMLSGILLSVVMLNVFMLRVMMLCVCCYLDIMLSANIPSVYAECQNAQ